MTGMPAAMDAAAAMEIIRRALGGDAAGAWPTVRQLWEHYKRAERGKLRSWSDTEQRGRHLLAFFGDRDALTLTPLDVDAYRERRRASTTRRGGPPTPATRNREVATLKRLCGFAVQNRLLPLNPLAGVALEAERNIRQTIVDEASLQRLLAACSPLLAAAVLTLADTGCRRMEVLRLRHDQLDLKAGVITLPADATKTGRPRRVRLTRRAAAAIRTLPKHGPLVFTPARGKPYCPRHFYRLFQAAIARAGLEGVAGEPIVLHSLRHSFVAKARRQGIPERVVMQMTGHTTRSAFDRYGGSIGEDEVDAAIASMEKATRRKGRR
jgi:integrase